jgi:hypothetical protein
MACKARKCKKHAPGYTHRKRFKWTQKRGGKREL